MLGQSFPFPHLTSCSLPQALLFAAQTLEFVSAWQPLQPLRQQVVHFSMTLYLVSVSLSGLSAPRPVILALMSVKQRLLSLDWLLEAQAHLSLFPLLKS